MTLCQNCRYKKALRGGVRACNNLAEDCCMLSLLRDFNGRTEVWKDESVAVKKDGGWNPRL